MSFNSFIDKIFIAVPEMLKLVKSFLNILMQNNFFVLIIYVILVFAIMKNLDNLINLIKNVFTRKKESSKNKQKNKSNIE